MASRTVRSLDLAIELGILATLVLSPLPFGSVMPWAQAALELLVVVLATLWVMRMLVTGSAAIRPTPVLWAWVGLLPLFAAQLLLHGWTASHYATWESFRLYIAYVLFFLVLGAYLVTTERIVRLMTVLVGWGVVLASWALVNRALGRDFLLWFDNVAYRGRLVSTFVNANHQALYFGILLFLALGMVLRPGQRSRGSAPATGTVADSIRGTGGTARVLFGGACAVLGVALMLTQSRAGVISVAVGLTVVMVLALQGRNGVAVALALAVGIAGFVGYTAWVGADALMDRFAIIAHEPSGDGRWLIWDGAMRLVRDAPITGSGLGAFEDAVLAHQSAIVADQWLVDYAHNDYLQLLAEGGIVAAILLVIGAGSWLWFVLSRWRDRRDSFVRGLVLGSLGAVSAVALHSAVDFGLHMPANALLFVTVLVLAPAVVTLRQNRAGASVDLPEWRWAPLGPRSRRAAWLGALAFVGGAGLLLVPAGAADWTYREAARLAGNVVAGHPRRDRAEVATADLSSAETLLRQAARLEPGNPHVQVTLASTADELARRTWSFGLTRDGVVLRSGSARERFAASQDLLAVAFAAYRQGLNAEPALSRTRADFAWFLARLDAVRSTVRTQGLSDLVRPDLRDVLGSDTSLIPWALRELREATRREPASSTLRRSLGTFALMYRAEIPSADAIAAQEFREAVQRDPIALREVVDLLLANRAEDLIWRSVPRTVPALVKLARILEDEGRLPLATAALEDAIAAATTPPEQATVYFAQARLALRRKDAPQGLAHARQALVLAPHDAEAFAVLGEAYDAAGQLERAQSAWGSAVSLAAGDPALNGYRGRLASVLVRQGDAKGALAIWRQIVESAPNSVWARLDLARLLEEQKEIAEALKEYETARVIGTGEKDAQQAVARAFVRHGLLREAMGAAEQGVRLDPSNDEFRVELADLFTRLGLSDRARQEYRYVLQRRPGHAAAERGLRVVGANAP